MTAKVWVEPEDSRDTPEEQHFHTGIVSDSNNPTWDDVFDVECRRADAARMIVQCVKAALVLLAVAFGCVCELTAAGTGSQCGTRTLSPRTITLAAAT